jgi:hypothetical protein
LLCAIAIERLPAAGSNKATLLYKPGGGGKFIKQANKNGQEPRDEEEGAGAMQTNEKAGNKGKSEKKGENEKGNDAVHAANT